MRLWSLNPCHLDARGFVALWQEGLLALAVIKGETKGYKHHPQLKRFLTLERPLEALECYLSRVLDEARARNYHFDESKITYHRCTKAHLDVTDGQLAFEWEHLLGKLARRDPERLQAMEGQSPTPHECFKVVEGPIADWERT